MSNPGQSPTVKRTRYTPQSADPVNPQDGDLFFSDGTPRAEGPWIWFNAAWQQVSTSGALSTVNNLTFTPQAADPGSPVEGMVFYADGTSRAAGLWLYNGSGWVQLSGVTQQEFQVQNYFTVRVATTANVTLASQVENGDTIDGVVLATGNAILIKNQTIASDNGVYVVQVSGAPIRHTNADSAAELNNYTALVSLGTVNENTVWVQTATLTTLADAQVWATTPGAQSFVVPAGVTEIEVLATGGGGGGGAGAGAGNGGGGGGGGGGTLGYIRATVIPGDTLIVTLGAGGAGGTDDGIAGGNTTITGTGLSLTFYGGGYGGGGGSTSTSGNEGGISAFAEGGSGAFSGGGGGASTGYGGDGGSTGAVGGVGLNGSGGGGGGGDAGGTGGVGGAGGKSFFVSTGAVGGPGSAGGGAGGGGGGASFAAGGGGGTGANTPTVGNNAAVNGGGGGGGGGGSSDAGAGAIGGFGAIGYARISWV